MDDEVAKTKTYKLRSGDLSWRDVEGEVIVLDERDWTYLSVNGSGAVLWPLVRDGTTAADLTDTLEARYDLDRERASQDVDSFLGMLAQHDLLAL